MAEALRDGLSVRDLACTRGGRRVFDGLGFDVAPGCVVQVLGANGSGKSSLLRLLCGLLHPTAGEVRWRDRRVGAPGAGMGADVAYLGHAVGMTGELTVLENLRFSLHVAGSPNTDADCRDVLARLRLAGREDEPCRHLSQGQQRRLGLARVLASRRPLWLLDEPCAGLDADGESTFDACLAEHVRGGGVAVVTTHRDIGRGGTRVRTLDMNGPCHAGADRRP